MNRGRRAAFTLIELLTVIAIIAVLAAIIFPVFGAVQENARRTSCMSNMRQISTGLKMYELDNRHYPDFLFAPAIKKFTGASGETNIGGCAMVKRKGDLALMPRIVTAGQAACSPEQASATRTLGGDYVDSAGNVIANGGLYPEYVPALTTFLCPDNGVYTANNDPNFGKNPASSPLYPVTGGATSVPVRYNADTLDKATVATFDDTINVPLYKFDSYDSNPAVQKDGSGNAKQKQDTLTWVARYARQWTPIVADPSTPPTGVTSAQYQAQTMWRNPSDDTVVTMCTYHVTGGKVVVLYLSGTAKVLDITTLKQKAATSTAGRDYDTFLMQP